MLKIITPFNRRSMSLLALAGLVILTFIVVTLFFSAAGLGSVARIDSAFAR